MLKRKKLGLALGSGSFRGPAHVGVIKTLEQNNIPIDFLAGSSIGAFVAAHYAVFQDIEKLENEMMGNQREKIALLFDISRTGGLLTGNRLERLFRQMLDGAEFKDAKIPLKIVATDIYQGETFVFQKGDLATAVRASVSVPLTFRPVKFKDKLLIDGGASNPVPDNVVKDMGADVIVSVNLYNHYQFENKKPNTSTVVMRGLEILLANLAKSNTHHTDILLEPGVSGTYNGPRLKKYYDKRVVSSIIKDGEKITQNKIEEIKKLLK
ncbi:MAG: patatin-like phospholipase family protein [Candidatus Falkowbacteria bacterium]